MLGWLAKSNDKQENADGGVIQVYLPHLIMCFSILHIIPKENKESYIERIDQLLVDNGAD